MSASARRLWKILLWIIAIAAAGVMLLILFIQTRWDASTGRTAPQLTAPTDSASIARGEYIFKYQAHCWGCHADGHADANSAPSGGRLFDLTNVGPGFGAWYTKNITPDVETGIGGWTDGEIVQAIREGVRRDRTAMFPLMPTDWLQGISDDDALALVAYMRSIPRVANPVRPQEPSFAAKALFAFGILKPQEAIAKPVAAPPRGATAEYGKYVATNLALCLDCHTPRNLENGLFFFDSLGAGSTIAFGEAEGSPMASYARNITPDKETGIGNWSEADLLAAITTGMRPDGTVLTPHMPYAYYKWLTDDDLKAIALYIRSLPPIRRTTPPSGASKELAGSSGVERGKLLFAARCQACHGQEGGGAAPTKVKLAEVAQSLSDADLEEMVKTGDLNLKMPSFRKTFRDDELADLIAYIRSWKTP